MNDYRQRTKVNTGQIIREKLDDLPNVITIDKPEIPPRERILRTIFRILVGRKGKHEERKNV